MSKTILHLCADIGSDSYPYAKAGYNVITVGENPGVENYHPPENIHGIIANPVCTEFSTAPGFHKKKDPNLSMINHCIRIINRAQPDWWVIENPANGTMKDYLGTPAATYQPWQYGSPWTKKTALWGNFTMPDPIYTHWKDVPKIPELYCRPGRPKPSLAFLHKSAKQYIREFDPFTVDSDNAFRSLCSQGFAHAFMEVNL